MKLLQNIIGLVILVGLCLLVLTVLGRAHDAPSGMPYPTSCCSDDGKECGPVPDRAINETTDGYSVVIHAGEHHHVHEGEIATTFYEYGHVSIRVSTDGKYHACVSPSYVSDYDSKRYGPFVHCILVPPESF